jgi:hypothetical protein
VSVGHVQRAIEAIGIPTVSVYVKSFSHIPSLMSLPRSIITRHPMGRPLGAPGDGDRQLDVVRAALALLESSEPAIIELDAPYRTP